MMKNNKNLTIEILLESLENDFDNQERENIFKQLKNTVPDDDALLGAKLILENNNWNHEALKVAFLKIENRIDNKVNENIKHKNFNFYLKYAAAVLLFLAIAGNFFYTNNSNSLESFYVRESGLPNLMDNQKTSWDELMQLYQSNQLEKAYLLSEKIKTQKPKNDTINYFSAIIAYDLKKYDHASKGFKNIMSNKESVFFSEAEYRLGFALKGLNHDNEARIQFQIAKSNPNNPYHEELTNVLFFIDAQK